MCILLATALAGCLHTDPPDVGWPGSQAPPIEIVTLDNQTWRLDAQRGTIVLLDLMGARCEPCRLAMVHLRETHDRFATDPGVSLLSVDMGALYPGLGARTPADLEAFVNQENGTWPFAWDPSGKVALAYAPIALPTLVIIDAEGIVAQRYDGGIVETSRILADIDAIRTAAA